MLIINSYWLIIAINKKKYHHHQYYRIIVGIIIITTTINIISFLLVTRSRSRGRVMSHKATTLTPNVENDAKVLRTHQLLKLSQRQAVPPFFSANEASWDPGKEMALAKYILEKPVNPKHISWRALGRFLMWKMIKVCIFSHFLWNWDLSSPHAKALKELPVLLLHLLSRMRTINVSKIVV